MRTILSSCIFFGLFVLPLFLGCHFLFANDTNSIFLASSKYKQWFAGPLFTPNATTVLPGHPAIEPVIIVSDTYGKYDSYGHLHYLPDLIAVIPYVDFQLGINERIGIEIIGLIAKNFCRGATSTHFKDTIVRAGYQISMDVPNSWIPDFRILFQETLPTGNYQKLNPRRNGTDCTGQGSYQTGVHFAAQKLFWAESAHPFRMRADFGYFFQSSVQVKGFNYYGGNRKTKGIVHPNKFFTIYLFGEFSLSRTWALGCELNYQHGSKGKFSRKRSVEIEVPAFNQFVIYPEIQHTISNNSAIILGGAFTISGKNSTAFKSFLFAFLHLF